MTSSVNWKKPRQSRGPRTTLRLISMLYNLPFGKTHPCAPARSDSGTLLRFGAARQRQTSPAPLRQTPEPLRVSRREEPRKPTRLPSLAGQVLRTVDPSGTLRLAVSQGPVVSQGLGGCSAPVSEALVMPVAGGAGGQRRPPQARPPHRAAPCPAEPPAARPGRQRRSARAAFPSVVGLGPPPAPEISG